MFINKSFVSWNIFNFKLVLEHIQYETVILMLQDYNSKIFYFAYVLTLNFTGLFSRERNVHY